MFQKYQTVKKIINETVSIFGRLDILVNSAGVFVEGPIDEVTEEEYDWLMDINTKGTFFTCKYVVPEIKKAGGGAIVNVSSDSGIMGNTNAALYCASKGAVTLLTKALAVDLAKDRIRVNCVCPGDVITPMLEEEKIKAGWGKIPEKLNQPLSWRQACDTRRDSRSDLFSGIRNRTIYPGFGMVHRWRDYGL